MLALAVVAGFLIGSLFLHAAWPASSDDGAIRWFRRSLSLGVGIAIQSLLGYISLLVTGSVRPAWFAEIVLAAVALFVLMRHRTPASPSPATDESWIERILLSAFAILVAIEILTAAGIEFSRWRQATLGYHDTVGIWNVRAQYLFAGGDVWRAAVSPEQSHGDYPLMLPLAVASFWSWVGDSSNLLAPFAIALSFLLALVGVVLFGLTATRDRFVGMVGVSALLGVPLVVIWSSALYADVPLIFFFTAVIVMGSLLPRWPESRPELLLVIGALLAFGAWTKNEGQLFAAVALASLVVVTLLTHGVREAFRSLAFLTAGIVLVGLPLIHFKLSVAPANDIVHSWTDGPWRDKIADPERWSIIRDAVVHDLSRFVPMWLAVALGLSAIARGIARPRAEEWCGWLTLGIMAGAYALVYAATPNELRWHLATSLDRLLLHLIPPTLVALCLLIRPRTESTRGWRLLPLTLAVAVCAGGAVASLRGLSQYPWPAHWQEYQQVLINTQTHRFAEHLPDTGAVGFVDSRPPEKRQVALYQAVRFFLAPRVVEVGLAPEWIAAFHPQKSDADRFAQEHGLTLIYDPETNLRLYRRPTP